MTDHRDAIWSGYCDGGPWAGRQLAHTGRFYSVYWTDPQSLPKPSDLSQETTIEVHSGYYAFDEGAWRWHPRSGLNMP